MTRNHIILLLTGFILLSMTSCSLAARVKKADKKYDIGEYYTASEQYKNVYRRIPSKDKPMRAHVAFNQAECYRILNNRRALNCYKNAIRYQYPDSIVYLRNIRAVTAMLSSNTTFISKRIHKTTLLWQANTPVRK